MGFAKVVLNVMLCPGSKRAMVSTRLWIGISFALIAILSVGRLSLITAPFPLDFNEGWNAAHAALAFGAGPLYPAPDALTGNNYPPLSFYIVGGAGRLIGDPIMAGRIIALLALLAVAASIFAAIRRFGGTDHVAPAVGALLFLAFNTTLFRPYLAMNDPQWLGHALMMAGFLCLIPNRPDASPGAKHVVAAVLLMMLGGMVKHNLLALPLAATIWLAAYHRRALAIWLVAGAGVALLAALICYRVFGVDAFLNVFASDRQFSWMRSLLKSYPVLAALAPLIVVSARLLRVRRSDARLDLLLLAAVIALALGFIQRGGSGVDKNAHFETLISLCIAGGVSFAMCGYAPDRPPLLRPLMLVLLPLLILLPRAVKADVRDFADRAHQEQLWTALENRIASTPGAVACELPAACFRAKKPYAIDFFLYGERVLIRHDDSALLRAIAQRRFAAVQLEPADTPDAQSRVQDPLPSVFEHHYRTVFVDEDGRRLLVPIAR